jgi:hypothetical protein
LELQESLNQHIWCPGRWTQGFKEVIILSQFATKVREYYGLMFSSEFMDFPPLESNYSPKLFKEGGKDVWIASIPVSYLWYYYYYYYKYYYCCYYYYYY